MTNEEKAKKIVQHIYETSDYDTYPKTLCQESALEMGEWKDKELKEYLEKRRAYYHEKSLATTGDDSLVWGGKEDAIEMILTDLFGE